MLLNRVEKIAMNNPVRALVHRQVEARTLLALGGPMNGGLALETGCGQGEGAKIILEVFKAGQVHGFDLDPDMVERAKKRTRHYGDRIRLETGDVTQINAPDNTYDAVFDFGIIHHVPRWRAALSEVFRVLKPGGRFYTEEVLDRFIHNAVVRRLAVHPLEDRFNAGQYASGLRKAGFTVMEQRELLGYFAWFIADKPQNLRKQ